MIPRSLVVGLWGLWPLPSAIRTIKMRLRGLWEWREATGKWGCSQIRRQGFRG
jgi:hypothetical protein